MPLSGVTDPALNKSSPQAATGLPDLSSVVPQYVDSAPSNEYRYVPALRIFEKMPIGGLCGVLYSPTIVRSGIRDPES